jgi:hypothetical protein
MITERSILNFLNSVGIDATANEVEYLYDTIHDWWIGRP